MLLENKEQKSRFKMPITIIKVMDPISACVVKLNYSIHSISFYRPPDDRMIVEIEDRSLFLMPRIEVTFRKCDAHLGHVFDDGSNPTGLRYCINAASLIFEARDSGQA